MADKEFLLGVKARELLKYTKQATKVVSDDISPQDVRAILHKIAQQVGAIIGEPLQPRRKITASPSVRQLRRLRQQRRSQPQNPPEAPALAVRPDGIPPWE